MRLLLDACVWGGSLPRLAEAGHDVVWAGAWADDPGDAEILRRAHAEGRVLVTLDKDFGELAVAREQPHSGIVRLVAQRARQQAAELERVLEAHADALARGAIVTVERGRVRVRNAT